jgi:hypothetical protein
VFCVFAVPLAAFFLHRFPNSLCITTSMTTPHLRSEPSSRTVACTLLRRTVFLCQAWALHSAWGEEPPQHSTAARWGALSLAAEEAAWDSGTGCFPAAQPAPARYPDTGKLPVLLLLLLALRKNTRKRYMYVTAQDYSSCASGLCRIVASCQLAVYEAQQLSIKLAGIIQVACMLGTCRARERLRRSTHSQMQ